MDRTRMVLMTALLLAVAIRTEGQCTQISGTTKTQCENVGIGTDPFDWPLLIRKAGFAMGGSGYGVLGTSAPGNDGPGVWLGHDVATTNPNVGIVGAQNYNSALAFWTHDGAAFAERARLTKNGFLGIGTTSPAAALHLSNAGPMAILQDMDAATPAQYGGYLSFRNSAGSELAWIGDGSATTAELTLYGSAGYSVSVYAGGAKRFLVTDTGNVGIGTTTPSQRLHVEGNVHVSGSINAKYQDVAEWVPTRETLSAGTVVVLDPSIPNTVKASTRAYDSSVAGVVSAQPGVLLGEAGNDKAMVATTGRVKVRVRATRPIAIGDLLVTSDMAGLAMPSEPIDLNGIAIHRPGTVLGKALEPMSEAEGEILVLLSLQ